MTESSHHSFMEKKALYNKRTKLYTFKGNQLSIDDFKTTLYYNQTATSNQYLLESKAWVRQGPGV